MRQRHLRDFPEGSVVSVPAAELVDGECLVLVRGDDAPPAPETWDYYGPRLAGWEVTESALGSSEPWERVGDASVRVRLKRLDALEEPALLERLRTVAGICVLEPGPKLAQAVKTLGEAGIPLRIDLSTRPDPDALLAAVDHYLHSEELRTPVEPFHGLLLAMSAKSDHSLWNMASEDIEFNFYVSDEGRVTLSKRWADAGLDYGAADDPWDWLMNSELFSRLGAFESEVPRKAGPCPSCEHLDVCRGFLRAVDEDWPCEPWQAAFGRLRAAVDTAKSILEDPLENAAQEPG